jgi:iron complex outermembrane receptor protein
MRTGWRTIGRGFLVATTTLCGARGAADAPAGAGTGITVTVTARKWTEPLQDVPGAVTVRSADRLAADGATGTRDAVRDVPGLTLGAFGTRRLTFPYVRGLGSGRNVPAVTTCVDGVPQLSFNTAEQMLLDVDRAEFLRGPQGALYGRNSLGGVINLVPRPPAQAPAGFVALSGGSDGLFGARGGAESPLGLGDLSGGLSGGYERRDGYTKNDLTGRRLDDREALFGRARLDWSGQDPWRFRLSVTAERDRDGDYALYDLGSLRASPHHVRRDFEGSTERDLVQPVFTAERRGEAADFTSITAYQWWRTRDTTDLDCSPFDWIRSDDAARQSAWIEELRLASPAHAPVRLHDRLTLRWLAGLFAFASEETRRATSDYRQDFVNAFYPGYVPPFQQHNDADLLDRGLGLFGQTTLALDERLELGLGLRADFEHRSADLRGYGVPPLPPPFVTTLDTSAERDFRQLSPQASLGFRLTPEMLAYVQAAKGCKSGGFNAVAPPGKTSFDDETSWNYEAGLKTEWFDRRLTANAAVFHTAWRDLQLDVPAGLPNQYYIDNAGRATSRGVELELGGRPCERLELFAGGALLDAEFRSGSQSGGMPVTGNHLPFAPRATWHAGAQYTQPLSGDVRAFARVETVGTGRFFYEPSNGASQGAFALTDVRLGVAAGNWRVEGWVKNLFDRDYVPLAFPFPLPGAIPSGYVGESGAPRTLGVSLTRTF